MCVPGEHHCLNQLLNLLIQSSNVAVLLCGSLVHLHGLHPRVVLSWQCLQDQVGVLVHPHQIPRLEGLGVHQANDRQEVHICPVLLTILIGIHVKDLWICVTEFSRILSRWFWISCVIRVCSSLMIRISFSRRRVRETMSSVDMARTSRMAGYSAKEKFILYISHYKLLQMNTRTAMPTLESNVPAHWQALRHAVRVPARDETLLRERRKCFDVCGG
ncbi:hypothetical protein E2C01_015121 [Portunus trituberculatus]|uniref:Uncharacterized protein n=1 Tax=Portunus trituberculatus TaxID=210409 RepID=A0A5B7DLZ1_PORTR|nr:hypothetical protein [Portunus trituberculatus]